MLRVMVPSSGTTEKVVRLVENIHEAHLDTELQVVLPDKAANPNRLIVEDLFAALGAHGFRFTIHDHTLVIPV